MPQVIIETAFQKPAFTLISILVSTRVELDIPVSTNLEYQYRASIRLRHQRVKIRLDNES